MNEERVEYNILSESIFLDVLHFPTKNITSYDLEATPIGGTN